MKGKSKKILALMLTFIMVLSMCTFVVSADSETTTEASEIILGYTDFSNGTTATYVTMKDGLTFYKRGKGVGTVTNSDKDGRTCIETTHTYMGYNFRKAASAFSSYGLATNPVVSVSYDINIPNDANKDKSRTFTMGVGCNSSNNTNSNGTVHNEFRVSYASGLFSANVNKASAVYNEPVAYEYGDWVTVKILMWIHSSNKLGTAVYIGDELAYYAIGTTELVGMKIGDISFCNEILDLDKLTNSTTTPDIITYYDDIYFKLLTADNKLSYMSFIDMDADALATTETVTSTGSDGEVTTKAEWNEEASELTVYKGKNLVNILENKGILGVYMLTTGATDGDAVYSVDSTTTSGRNALKIVPGGYTFLTQNIRQEITKYVNSGDAVTLVGGYDVYITKGSEGVSRKHGLNIGSATSAKGSTEDISFTSNIVGNKLTFDAEIDNLATVNDFERSEAAEVPSGEWITVTYLIELTFDTDHYDFTLYGVYDNKVIYTNAGIIEDEGFGINVHTIRIGEDGDKEFDSDSTTLYDNIYFEKNNNYDKSLVNFDAWSQPYVTPVLLTYDSTNGATAEVRSYVDKFTTGTFVVAVYNKDGAVEGNIITSTTPVDAEGYNSFKINVPAADLQAGYTVKGFLFDALSSSKPLTENAVITISAE